MSASDLLDVFDRLGYPRVRLRDAVRGGFVEIRSRAQWLELVRQLKAVEVAGATNPCAIVRAVSTMDDTGRAVRTGVESSPDSFHDLPRAVPTAAQRTVVDAAIADAATVLDLPRLRIRFVERRAVDDTLAVASCLRDEKPGTVGISIGVNGTSLTQLRRTVLHELRHAADLRLGLHITLSVPELERRADEFADRIFPLRLTTR